MPLHIPINKTIPDTKFPEFEVQLISNVKLYFIEDKEQDILKVRIMNKAGTVSENIQGLSWLTHDYLSYGFEGMNYEKISEVQELIGASMNASASKDSGSMEITVLAEFADKALDLILNCYFNPSFPKNELEHLKKNQIALYNQYKSNPGYLAEYACMNVYYSGHQYAETSFGTISSIKSISIDDVKNFHNDKIMKSEHAIYISGKYDKEKILKIISEFLKYLNGHNKFEIKNHTGVTGKQIAIINKKDAVQSNLEICSFGIDALHPDNSAVKIANLVFGGFFMSRLNEIIREKHGFTYGIHSNFIGRRFSNEFTISSSLNSDNLKKSIELIDEIKLNFSSNSISEEEFQRAIRYFLGNFNNYIETHVQISNFLKNLFILDLPFNYYNNMFDEIRNLTLSDVFRAQKKYFNPDNYVVAVSGAIEIIRNQVQNYGNIIEVNL